MESEPKVQKRGKNYGKGSITLIVTHLRSQAISGIELPRNSSDSTEKARSGPTELTEWKSEDIPRPFFPYTEH